MMSLLVRTAVSMLGGLLLGGILLYVYMTGLIGNPSASAKWLLPLFFYTGITLCLTGVIFTVTNNINAVRWSFILATLVLIVFAIFQFLIEPQFQRLERQSLIETLHKQYQQNSYLKLKCDNGFEVHLSKIEAELFEVILFQKNNYADPIQRLAGWEKSTSMNQCRFIENFYLLGTQRRFLDQCRNQQQASVADLIAQAKHLGCQ